jgi:hypothetical protein
MRVRVAAAGAGGRFHLDAGGRDVSGPLTIPNTGGWQNWTTVEAPVTLAAGVQAVRLVLDANGPTGVFGNVNFLTFARATAPPPPPPAAGAAQGAHAGYGQGHDQRRVVQK